MKKFLSLLMSICILSIGLIVPSYAEDLVSADVSIVVNTPSTIEITGDSNLPEQTTIEVEDTYICKLTFDRIGTYKYKIKEIPKDNEDIIYDTTVYDVEVLVINEDGLKAYVSIYVEGETTKKEAAGFNNTIKDKTTELSITKVDENGDPLEGAYLVLIDKETSTEIEKWKSTKEAKEFILNEGIYILHEESAPNGYLKVDNFDFTVEEGNIILTETDNVTLNDNNIIVEDPKVIVPEKPTKTGDGSNLLIYIISLISSIVLIGIILIRRRKHAKDL